MRARGFTIIELLMSLTIVGLLSAIAVPKFLDMRRHAEATKIMGDFGVVRHAILSFYADSSYYPPDANPGEVPQNLTKYLPANFQMKKPQWELDYENWDLKTGTKYTTGGEVIGLSFTTVDTLLGRRAMSLMGDAAGYTTGTKYTLLISAF